MSFSVNGLGVKLINCCSIILLENVLLIEDRTLLYLSMFGDFMESGMFDFISLNDLLKLFLFSLMDFFILEILDKRSLLLGPSMKGLFMLF